MQKDIKHVDYKHKDLIDACALKDRKAYMKIYDLYYKAMYNTSFSIVNDSFLAAENIINNVIVDLSGSKEKVVLECELNQKKSGHKKINVSIDVDIFMPSTISFELEHMFGTAFVESVSGPAKISSEYGSIEITSLSNTDNDLELSFGEANINNINNGKLEVGYSRLDIKKSNSLSVESEYSDLTIGNVKDISFELEGGNVNLGHVDNLDLETSFSNIEIGDFTGSLSCEIDYGVLVIRNIDKDFSSIEIENSFGTIDFNFDKNSTYKFNIEGEFLSFDYPENNAKISYRNESDFSTIVKGVIGKSTNPKSMISIESEYGTVNFTDK